MAHRPDDRAKAACEVEDRRIESGRTWQQLADHLGRPPIWTVAALLGSHPMPSEEAASIGKLLELTDETVRALQRQPYRTADHAVSTDPTFRSQYSPRSIELESARATHQAPLRQRAWMFTTASCPGTIATSGSVSSTSTTTSPTCRSSSA